MNALNSSPTFRGGNCRVWISERPLSLRVFSRKKQCLSKKDNRGKNMLNLKASAFAMSAQGSGLSKDQTGLDFTDSAEAKHRPVGKRYL